MGMSPLGTPESVSSLGLDGAKNFYGRGLLGSRVVVAGAGAVKQVRTNTFVRGCQHPWVG